MLTRNILQSEAPNDAFFVFGSLNGEGGGGGRRYDPDIGTGSPVITIHIISHRLVVKYINFDVPVWRTTSWRHSLTTVVYCY